uniref:Uncharacterized protein n=1 Tax=Meloidogyne hapla TaxID=6305 RepID=A0A1I8C214_MELHA
MFIYGDLALTLKTNQPIQTFSASFQQTLLIQLIGSSNYPEHEISGLSQLDKRASEPSGKNKKSHRLSQSCKRLSEAQKYDRLEAIGGRNQQFTANSPTEAAKNFPSLLPNPIEEKDEEITLLMNQNDDPQYLEDEIIKLKKCDSRCQEIKKKLEKALNDIGEWDWYDQLNDSPELLEEIPEIGRKKRKGCILEKFLPVGNCTEHGFEEAQGSEKLCTAFRNCFPLFVNSVVCGRNEKECIYDRMSGAGGK